MGVKVISQGRQLEYNLSNDNKNFGASIEVQENKEKIITKEDLDRALGKLNKFMEGEKTHAEYEVHDKLKDIIIKIVENDTSKVIMEIPPKKILDMVAAMCEMVGIIFDKHA